MSDELNRLKRAFEQQGKISPRRKAREFALKAAMKEFAPEKIADNSQTIKGTGLISRLIKQGNTLLHAFQRRRMMKMRQFKQMLAGSVSLAVLAVAIINIDQIAPNLMMPKPVDTGVKETPALTDLKTATDDNDFAQNGIIDGGEGGSEGGEEVVLPLANNNTAQPVATLGKQENEIALMEMAPGNVDRVERTDEAASVEQKAYSPSVQFDQSPPGMASKLVGNSAQKKVKTRTMVAARSASQPDYRINIVRGQGDIATPGTYQDQGRDKFANITDNPTRLVADNPVSTFSIDVDSASYSYLRASLNRGVLPQMDAVRVEELINYFNYDYKAPIDADEPFATHVSIMPTPWNANTKLLQIGIKGYELQKASARHANLVFLIDTSGSMNSPDKLPLLRNSFKLLLASLRPDDTVAIVTYAGSAGTVLQPTKVADKNKIISALERLGAGGSTHGAAGIHQAYQLAEQQFDADGVNRVILATDGDFNVGITNPDELKNFVQRKRKTGVTLSVLGFGHGNYNDQLMQALAQNGNGNAAYIDTLSEARKVLVDQAGATLFTIAKDVKLQLEFNPAMVSEYRLIGYETRQLRREDFNNDKVDAGDIGAGHSLTALYEITPAGASTGSVDGLRYQNNNDQSGVSGNSVTQYEGEYGFMKIRYKLPTSDVSQLITYPVSSALEVHSVNEASQNARFAAAVAAFGQILRGGRNTGSFTYDDVIDLALSARGEDRFGYRAEFINLVRLASTAAALQPGNQ